jgi:hypothetical protein
MTYSSAYAPQPPPEPGGELDKLPQIGYSASVWLETRQVVGSRWQVGKGFLPAGPSIRRTVRAGKQSLCRLSLSTVNGPATAGRLSPGECTAKKEFFFCGSDAGISMKTKDRCAKGGAKAGMFMKTKVVMR